MKSPNSASYCQPWHGIVFFIFLLFNCFPVLSQKGNVVLTDPSQKDFLKAYKTVFDLSDKDYRGTSATLDSALFPKFGEFSVYWKMAGADQGSFVIPDILPARDSSVTVKGYTGSYDWKDSRSIQFKNTPKKVAVFRSKMLADGYSVSWEAQYFKSLFETFLFKNVYYYVNEDDISNGLSDSTQLLIIPSFTVHPKGEQYYVDSIFMVNPQLQSKLQSFLSKGGFIYTEGNAAYVVQKIGYLSSVDFSDKVNAQSNQFELSSFSTTHPVAFAHSGVNDYLYGSSIPKVNAGAATIIASLKSDSRPVIFELSADHANGGRIVCNLGIPTVGGISEVERGSRQLQWTFNTLLYAFSHPIDVTRSVWNSFPSEVLANRNSVSYDRIDTFEVHIQVRNLSDKAITNLTLKENLRNYFTFIDANTTSSVANGVVTFGNISLSQYEEKSIIYRVATPKPDSTIHDMVDKLIDYDALMAASVNTTGYSDDNGIHRFTKQRDYADIMFSARIFGDADINWKNFLKLHWQPFKVFMIMENKERTEAENTVYTQYIPKDMPFYRTSDGTLNIPVVKTPGGTFIDVLKGSDDRNNPEFDMDGDGDPDVWLDTASIYPKGFQIETTEVYWANPWKTTQAKLNHHDTVYYEDINHDGNSGYRVNGVDYNLDDKDKIRAWKITWPVGTVKGYDYFDPYCSMEVWVDAPDMVAMAQGVAYASGKSNRKEGFYPYELLDDARTSYDPNGSWKNWMDKDKNGDIIWTGMYKQQMYNYQGYAFMDPKTYTQKPWDTFYDTVPKPHEEFIAVLSMGGEEIDMYNPLPSQSLYSKIEYNTIFNEHRTTPIRTTYSYYAPLPNPLQFEYLASNYSITDTLNNPLAVLPAKGKAKLRFDLDASTEYSYYWIRNMGHKVERQAPWIKDNVKNLGSGVFGYMIYEIPKGMGGYKITLPRKADGSYDTDGIVQINGKNFEKWLTNPNTDSLVRIWEDPFSYQIYVPQLLIPPAICDKDGDGVDDWIDDTGDRFQSNTGYLRDAFMPGDSTWKPGADGKYGSDEFDELGRVHFTINALYEGKGKEGPVDISKGGTIVVEEIFGGSPWVIFSHALTANAEGVDYKVTSSASPVSVRYGTDTICIKHVIEDANEPHEFNGNFDPYRASFGSARATATSTAGGMDPCDWISPNYATTTIIDPKNDHVADLTLIPNATKSAALTAVGFPKHVSGTFLEVKVEVMNDDIEGGKSYEWLNTAITPDLSKAGNSKVVLSYVSYPRPLVPGDQPATDTTGWRFNQPEGEVLINLGDTMKSRLQTTRRAYFVFVISIDETLPKGIYPIGFSLSGDRRNYTGVSGGKLLLKVAPVKFSIVEKGADNKPKEYQKFRIGEGALTSLSLNGTEYFAGLNQVKWSAQDVDYTNFSNLTTTLPASYNKASGQERIDLSSVGRLPNADTSKIYLLEKVAVNSYRATEDFDLTTGENLTYNYNNTVDSVSGNKISVSTYGPKILIRQTLYSVNGVRVADSLKLTPDNKSTYIVTRLDAINVGSDLSSNTMVGVNPVPFYNVLKDSLASNIKVDDNGIINVNLGSIVPGGTQSAYIYYTLNQSLTSADDIMTVIKLSNIGYQNPKSLGFNYNDTSKVLFTVNDLQIESVTCTKTNDSTFHITAKAVNRGLPASNIWFRIYPVVGGKISEIPIGQTMFETIKTSQEVELTVDYVLPNTESIQVYAKIDDGDDWAEIFENNNAEVQTLSGPLSTNELKKVFAVKVFPNPFTDQVEFDYQLSDNAQQVSIEIYTPSGQKITGIQNCPSTAGSNTFVWVPSVLNSGNYLYKITIVDNKGITRQINGLLIKTDK